MSEWVNFVFAVGCLAVNGTLFSGFASILWGAFTRNNCILCGESIPWDHPSAACIPKCEPKQVEKQREALDMLQPLGHTGPQYDATRCTPPQ